jgi:alanine racemase
VGIAGAGIMPAMPLAPREWGGRPVWAEIDLDAVAHNVKVLLARAAPAKVYAVVKANAYGHGAVAVGRAALEAGAAALAVVCVDEGEELRRANVTAPLLVLGHTPASDAERVVALGLEPAVGGAEIVERLAVFARRRGTVVPLHLELETGMNRHGLAPEALVSLAERARTLPGVRVKAIFTHFAAAEEGDQGFTRGQLKILKQVSARLPWIPERHCSASASVLLDHDMALEAVRPGLSIYGYRPAPGCGADAHLELVLSLRSRVARVAELPEGASVGYGRAFRAKRPSRVALVMCGYADGYRRALGGRAQVLVRGRRAPVIGRVAMDMCMVDVTDLPGVVEGDVVTLLGCDGEARVDADELAELCGTISWEILTGVSARVPRLYLRSGEAVEVSTLCERAPQKP